MLGFLSFLPGIRRKGEGELSPVVELLLGLHGVVLHSGQGHPDRSSVILTDSLNNMKGYRPVVSHYASPKRFWDKDAVLLLQNIPSAPHLAQVNQPVKRVSRVALPDRSLNLSKLKPGAYHIFSCLRPAKRKTVAADCVEAGQLNRPGLRQIAKPKKKSGQ